jgi:transposase
MEHYAGIDVSLEQSSVCVVDARGRIVRKAKVASERGALVAFFRALGLSVERIGLEAGPLSQWLHAGLSEAGFEAALLETRQVKAALSAMTVKTDRKDARGIAQLVRMGWYRGVHCKTLAAQELRALLGARKLLQGKLHDVELSIRGLLRAFGLKVGKISKGRYAARIRELIAGQAMLSRAIEPMLRARAALWAEFQVLHAEVLAVGREDAVCRQLMTAPGVGAVVALSYKAMVDDPRRFKSSKDVGPHVGLTPRKYQSGETDVTGRISKVGDAMARTALYEAAQVILTRVQRPSGLKRWGLAVAKRRGKKRAIVAVARKLATILHRMWVDGSEFRWGKQQEAAAAAA